jgi:hypothetical protein
MRDNSGKGKSKNNVRDPTLKEHEAGRGRTPERSSRETEMTGTRAADAAPRTGRPRSGTAATNSRSSPDGG